MTIKITSKTITEREVEITPPLFFKSKTMEDYYALIDENTFVNAWTVGKSNAVSVQEPGSRLETVYNEMLQITEDEFFAAYNKIFDAVNLNPVLIERPNTEPDEIENGSPIADRLGEWMDRQNEKQLSDHEKNF